MPSSTRKGLPPGISGNPSGGKQKRKERVLTKVLQEFGDKDFVNAKGNPTTYVKETARLVWQLATEGKAEFQNGLVLKAGVRDWKDTVNFIFNQCDGPARLEQDINLSGADSALAQAPIEHLMALVKSVDVTKYLQQEEAEDDQDFAGAEA